MADYGKRPDGTPKGIGFFGEIKRPDGMVSTELSAGFNFGRGETLAPLLVPTLTREEIDHLISGKQPTTLIFNKAADFAKKRLGEGKSPFAAEGELYPMPEPFTPIPLIDILHD